MAVKYNSSVSRPFATQLRKPCRIPHTITNKQIAVCSKSEEFGRDVVNTTLGLTLSASLLIFGGFPSQAALSDVNFADQTLREVQEKIDQDLSYNFQESLDNKVAVVSSKRAEIFQKLREEAGQEEQSSPTNSKTSSIKSFGLPPSSSAGSKAATSKPVAQFKKEKQGSSEVGDGTFNSSQPVYIGGAVALAAVIGGVAFTNSKSSSTTTGSKSSTTKKSTTTKTSTATASTQNKSSTTTSTASGPSGGLAEAEAWVANWKNGSTQQVDVNTWVANWRAKQKK